MGGKQLLGSQRFRCAVSILNYFLIEVFSFPLSLVCSFRGRNILKEGGFVTPRPDEVHRTCNCRDTYVYQVQLQRIVALLQLRKVKGVKV